jgi:hypothetical protein
VLDELDSTVIRQISATQLRSDHPISSIALEYFHRLAAGPRAFDRPAAKWSVRMELTCFGPLSRPISTPSISEKEALQATLAVRTMKYVQMHLREPDLDAGRIVAGDHIFGAAALSNSRR